MTTRKPRTPSYRLHKPSGQAVVEIAGKMIYLGPYRSSASRDDYDRIVSQWLASGRGATVSAGADPTVNELMLDYIRHADGYYVKDGRPTSEAGLIRQALRVLRRLYGPTPAKDFGPLALKAVRQAYIDAGLCRREVNRRTGLVVRFFKWAVENERVPPSVHHGLRAVAGLRKGRSGVREAPPVKPVPDAFVDAIRPHVARQVWAMIELQRLTGMRPGEVVIMRACDIDAAGKVWVYTPESHKTEHLDKPRQIYLGPRAQALVKPWLRTELAAYLFSPAQAMAEHREAERRVRKTRVQPSQHQRRKASPNKVPKERYTTGSYRRAIAGGCDKAFPHPVEAEIATRRQAANSPAERRALAAEWNSWVSAHQDELATWRSERRWHPNQLRHNAATSLRREFGLDVARVILGHSSPVVTEV